MLEQRGQNFFNLRLASSSLRNILEVTLLHCGLLLKTKKINNYMYVDTY